MTKIAINGFGRIGRPVFRLALDSSELEVVAINDLTDTQTLTHLLKYDSIYGKFNHQVSSDKKHLIIDGQKFPVYQEQDPANLPWKDLKVDIVLECTGHFTTSELAKKHLTAGAKRVLLSAPPKSSDIPIFVLGVNQQKFNPKKDFIVSNGSCTTNALAPLLKVLHDQYEIEYNLMTTIHSYTNDQKLLDLPHSDLRRARAAAQNIIPTTTGATKSVIVTIPELEGKLDGLAIRVPTAIVSLIDLVCLVKKSTTVKEVNNQFKQAAKGKLKGILDVIDQPLVSSDFIGNSHSTIVDLPLTMVSKKGGGTGEKGNLIKIIAWYDNEYGYACRYLEMAEYISRKI